MLYEICEHLHNFFDTRDTYHYEYGLSLNQPYYSRYIDRSTGTFTISDGLISPLSSSLIVGQYIRIVGSLLNDGIYLLPDDFTIAELQDETFTGAVFGLAIPKDLVTLSTEISAYVAANPASAYTSESFGGWSGTKATGASGAPLSWKTVYGARLNRWRKL